MNVIVIGANFGDEGKGRVVDFLAKQFANKDDKPALNIRFSGSNNAAHTVWKDGKSFIFHLLGAAAFNDVPTYLSQHVVVDFAALSTEINNFKLLTGKNPIVYVDPRCRLNLPFDVMTNRIKEIIKGADKHGSTGNGLNETIDRHATFPINAGMFEVQATSLILTQKKFVQFVEDNTKGVDLGHHQEFTDTLTSGFAVNMVFTKIKDIINNNSNIILMTPNLQNYDCIFEGSQGLALDEYSQYFPHVTRTRTGTTNVIDICREHNIKVDEVYYVTRTYLTRHGADKNFNEFIGMHDHYNIVDETNIPNEWQDDLKFAILDISQMEDRIYDDFKVLKSLYKDVKQYRVFTCLDQNKGGTGLYIRDNYMYSSSDFKSSMENLYSIGKLSDIELIFFDNKENI